MYMDNFYHVCDFDSRLIVHLQCAQYAIRKKLANIFDAIFMKLSLLLPYPTWVPPLKDEENLQFEFSRVAFKRESKENKILPKIEKWNGKFRTTHQMWFIWCEWKVTSHEEKNHQLNVRGTSFGALTCTSYIVNIFELN